MTWEKAGEAGVDAGLIFIGDPYYLVDDPDSPPELPFTNWHTFIDYLADAEHEGVAQILNDKSAPLGVAVSRFGGDGRYSVFVERDYAGYVIGAQIRFDGVVP